MVLSTEEDGQTQHTQKSSQESTPASGQQLGDRRQLLTYILTRTIRNVAYSQSQNGAVVARLILERKEWPACDKVRSYSAASRILRFV